MSFVNIEYMEELSRPGIFELASLPWAKNALAPVISEETINFHYGKHHSGYVSKLAAGASAAGNGSKSVLDIIKEGKANSQYNLAAQHWNHAFYWKCLSPNGGGEPSGALAEGISKTWGSFEAFKEKFSASAAGHFGSGWAWLVQDSQGALKIVDTHDAANPITDGYRPILTCDVWEHAYYIDFRNDRASYVNGFWKLVNWDFAASLYKE